VCDPASKSEGDVHCDMLQHPYYDIWSAVLLCRISTVLAGMPGMQHASWDACLPAA